MSDPCVITKSIKIGVHFDVLQLNIRLVYVKENCMGAKLHVDPSNCMVVKLETTLSIPSPYVMETFQGDRYIGIKGTTFLISPTFEDMTSLVHVPQPKACGETSKEASMAARPSITREIRSELYHLVVH